MKKGSLFAKIIYYLFTFSLGIILAIFLPFIYLYDGEVLNIMQESLDAGNYVDAMAMAGGYYNKEPVLNAKFPAGGGIVLFESATLYEQEYGEGDQIEKQYKMHKSYAGFVYQINGFNVHSHSENKTKLLINTTEGVKEFEILNCDTNGDEQLDHISSLLSNNFFFLELPEEELEKLAVKDILSLKFVTANGSEYAEVQTTHSTFSSANLFKTQFFNDVQGFIQKNNQLADYSALYKEAADYEQRIKELGEELNALDGQILQNANYAKSNTDLAKTSADRRATKSIIIYFVCVYVIGDFLLGTKYILRFIKWFGVKVLKIKPREKKVDKSLFGTDYFSQVELKLETVGLTNNEEIKLTYSNEKENVTFTLNYVNGYTDKQRMKAGVYTLEPSDLQEKYNVEFIPTKIIAEGYKKAVQAKIIRREEDAHENNN